MFTSFIEKKEVSAPEIPHNFTAIGCINLHMNAGLLKMALLIEELFKKRASPHHWMLIISVSGNASVNSTGIIKSIEIIPKHIKTESRQRLQIPVWPSRLYIALRVCEIYKTTKSKAWWRRSMCDEIQLFKIRRKFRSANQLHLLAAWFRILFTLRSCLS